MATFEQLKTFTTQKRAFEYLLEISFGVTKIDGPMLLAKGTGLQDFLSGKETPLGFKNLEIPHSLAKWKRHFLYHSSSKGIVIDMRAVRQDEVEDATHSYYVDQFDFEKVINPDQRNITFLKEQIQLLWTLIREMHPSPDEWPEFITFADACDEQKEDELVTKHKAVAIIGIDGSYGRSPDYDDWTLNYDILVYHPTEKRKALELSSGGIRVTKEVLLNQSSSARDDEYFNSLDLYPLTFGGGIGQSRLLMFWNNIDHINNVRP